MKVLTVKITLKGSKSEECMENLSEMIMEQIVEAQIMLEDDFPDVVWEVKTTNS